VLKYLSKKKICITLFTSLLIMYDTEELVAIFCADGDTDSNSSSEFLTSNSVNVNSTSFLHFLLMDVTDKLQST